MHLGDTPQPSSLPDEVDHHGQPRRQLTVQRRPVKPGRGPQGLQTGRYVRCGIRVNRAFSELADDAA